MIEAVTWAFALPIRPSATKFVLVAISNCANERGIAYPSIAYLAQATCQDRKTVITAIDRLIELGYLVDTDKRVGKTQQVKVYRLADPTVPKTVQLNGTDTGTVDDNQTVPFFRRNSTVFPGNSTVFPGNSTENGTRNRKEPSVTVRNRDGARKRATSIPDDFIVTDDMRAWAYTTGHQSDQQIDSATAHFLDHHRAKGSTFRDWFAAWRTWMRNELKFNARHQPATRKNEMERAADALRSHNGTDIERRSATGADEMSRTPPRLRAIAGGAAVHGTGDGRGSDDHGPARQGCAASGGGVPALGPGPATLADPEDGH